MTADGPTPSRKPTDLLFVVARGMLNPRLKVMPPALRQLWAAHDASGHPRPCDCRLVITTRTRTRDENRRPTISVNYALVRGAPPGQTDEDTKSFRLRDLDELRTLTPSQLSSYLAARRAQARHQDAVTVAMSIGL